MRYCRSLADELRELTYHGRSIEVEIDDRDLRGGEKVWSWIKKGAPIRLEVGPRDMAEDSVFMGRRDLGPKEKKSIKRAEFVDTVAAILDEMQQGLFDRALAFREANTRSISSDADFRDFFTPSDPDANEIHGGFAITHFCMDPALEARMKDELGVTIRCVPRALQDGPGTCPFSGSPAEQKVVWAKAY
jgi:prolyl-tRNA synthetase